MTLAVFKDESLGYGATTVLRGVSLVLTPGERVVLLGRSGAGKSTLLSAIYAKCSVGGARVALVPQDHSLVPQLSVAKNVFMGRLDDHNAFYNLANLVRMRRVDRSQVSAVIAGVGLSGKVDVAVEDLSGGQKQRTALARALYRGGDVLVADEPVSAVDPLQSGELLARMRSQFSTVVLALHDVDLARSFSDRLIGIRGGTIEFDAPASQVPEAAIGALYAD